jgi:hypothetical protein
VHVRKFEAVLVRPEGTGTWTYFVVPFDSRREFGTKSRIQVRGTIDGLPYKSTLLPSGVGGHFMVVRKQIRETIGKTVGNTVTVTIELDPSPRVLTVPKDLVRALEEDSKARKAFAKMTYSHKKSYVEWIEEAKTNQVRERRINRSLQMIPKGTWVR